MEEAYLVSSRAIFDSAQQRSFAGAFVMEGERITRVLPSDEATAAKAYYPQQLDFGDALITPGLHDAHMHVLHAALFPSALAAEFVGANEADCRDKLCAFAASRPDDGSWLLCHGWRDNLWDPPVTPSKDSLDAAFPHRPVAMYSGDAHTLWVNSAGLAALGINEGTPNPAGGSFDRDEQGKLTGIIREAAAMSCIAQVVSSFSQHELEGIYRDFFAKLSSRGITAVCDMALSTVPGADSIYPQVYEALLETDQLNVRAHLFPCLGDDQSQLEDLQARFTGSMVQAPGFKQFFDGVSSQHTAWCSEPYANPRFAGDCGRPTLEPARMRELVLAAASRGHAVRIHTIGDAAVHEAINIFEEAYTRYGVPTQGAHTIEHVEDIQPRDIDRMAAIGLVASVQPPHVTIDITQPERDLGAWRAERMWPFASFIKAGTLLAFGSDAPVVAADSREILYCAVARQEPQTARPAGGWYPEYRVSPAQALAAYTLGSACAVGRQHELGQLAPGMLADFVVWDRNLLSCSPDELLAAQPLATYVGGRCVYAH